MNEFDFDRAAVAMFGGTTPTAVPASAQGTTHPDTDEQVMAERLYGGTKPTTVTRSSTHDDRPIAELTEDELAQKLYGNTDPTLTHADATQAILNAGMQDHLHEPEEAREIATQWAEVFQQHKLNASDSKELADLGATALRNPPTEDTIYHWTETAIANLQAEYGVQGAGQALQDARAYIAGVPDAADMLNALGLGSHPKIVALAAARGRAMRQAGKLK